MAIFGQDPKIVETVREQLKTEDGQNGWQEIAYRKLNPLIAKRWGEDGVDFESWFPFLVVTSEEYFSKIVRDDSVPGGVQIPAEYEAEEILLPDATWSDFVADEYEKGYLFVFFSVDV